MTLESSLYESYKAGRQIGEDESRNIKRKKKETLRNPSLTDTNDKNSVELNCSESESPTYGMAENNHHSSVNAGGKVKSLLHAYFVWSPC